MNSCPDSGSQKKLNHLYAHSYLGILAPANVQHRSIHITDIQQNIEIPEIYNEYPKPEQIKGESKIQNSSDVCCPGLTLYINTKRMVVINTEVTLHITKKIKRNFA